MYKMLKEYADNHEPLARPQELDLIENTPNDADLFHYMIMYNARMIVQTINRWQSTYEPDDAASIIIMKLWKDFDKWDKLNYNFYYFANLRISAALHRNIKKYAKGFELNVDECHYEDKYDDIMTVAENNLTENEWNLIDNVYNNGGYIKDFEEKSGDHGRILDKLRKIVE